MNTTYQLSIKGMKPTKKKVKKSLDLVISKNNNDVFLTGEQFEQNLIKRINRHCDDHGIL
jgi:hypothetical protein